MSIQDLSSDTDSSYYSFTILSSLCKKYQKIFTSGKHIVTDLINALPGNSSVITVQQATIEEAMFSVDSTDAPVDWLDNDHMMYVYCRSMSVPRVCK
jgi:hypothetical protein